MPINKLHSDADVLRFVKIYIVLIYPLHLWKETLTLVCETKSARSFLLNLKNEYMYIYILNETENEL